MLLEKYRSSSNLAAAGATLTREPDGQRIIAGQVVELLTLSSSGAFMVLTEGSTKLVAEVRTFAGTCPVKCYSFVI